MRRGWMRVVAAAVVTVGLSAMAATAQTGWGAKDQLRVYFVDVEGGQATLFVTPTGESLLIDTGWQDNGGRDADRIVAAARAAGLRQIDTVLITHFHEDHVGGVPQLLERIPVKTFLDHGENREMDHGITEKGYAEYLKAIAAKGATRRVMHPGEVVHVGAMTATVISADGKLIEKPLPGGGQRNPFCAASEKRAADETENARSLGVELRFGKLRLLDLGDLTWDKEMELMCPVNKLGKVDVYIVSHHGWNKSSSPALVHAIGARVAIMDNGEKKGGSTPTFDTLATAPGLQALWQVHASAEAGAKNTPERLIANPMGTDAGFDLELAGATDGSFTVRNGRTGETVRYPGGRTVGFFLDQALAVEKQIPTGDKKRSNGFNWWQLRVGVDRCCRAGRGSR